MFTGNSGSRLVFIYLGIFISLMSAGSIAWCFWPLSTTEISLKLSGDKLQAIYPDTKVPTFLLQEQRSLVVKYPGTVRLGEPQMVTLTWKTANSQPALPSNSSINDQPSILTESRLDILGFSMTPSGSIDAPLPEGQTISLSWQITPIETGLSTGTIWSYLSLPSISNDNSNDQSSQNEFKPIAAQDFNIRVISLFGLGISTLKWLSYLGIPLGVGLVLFAILRRLPRKRKQHKRIRR
jgi:hypothetical protein